jgi:hypothetical protein
MGVQLSLLEKHKRKFISHASISAGLMLLMTLIGYWDLTGSSTAALTFLITPPLVSLLGIGSFVFLIQRVTIHQRSSSPKDDGQATCFTFI